MKLKYKLITITNNTINPIKSNPFGGLVIQNKNEIKLILTNNTIIFCFFNFSHLKKVSTSKIRNNTVKHHVKYENIPVGLYFHKI